MEWCLIKDAQLLYLQDNATWLRKSMLLDILTMRGNKGEIPEELVTSIAID